MPDTPIILFTLYGEQIEVGQAPVDRIVSKAKASSLMDHVRELIPI
jgi:hypothetical protein